MKHKVKSAVKKIFYKTKWWKWKVMRNMSNHRHRLIPKWKRVKQAAWKNHWIDSNVQSNKISSMLK